MDYSRPPGQAALTPRRTFTEPPRRLQDMSSNNGYDIDTLYSHPSVKIVSFTAGPRNVPASPGREAAPPAEPEPGTLPWSSQLERTIAVGAFRIYRAPGSVAFLSCGSALQPILPKSQCWCIDEGSSKFILQIRRPQFWRIEIPIGSSGDDGLARLLRDVFDKVLLFEKTPCPFKRAFTVVLPERPQTPARKRPWTPVRSSVTPLPPTPVTPVVSVLRLRPPEAGRLACADPDTDAAGESPHGGVLAREEPQAEEAEAMRAKEGDSRPHSPRLLPLLPGGKLAGFQANRSVTAPPQLSLNTSPPSKSTTQALGEQLSENAESSSPTDSSDSFHSVQSWHSPIAPLPPSPPLSHPSSPETFPYPHDTIELPKRPASHQRDVSDATITPLTDAPWELGSVGADELALESPSETSSVYDDAEKAESNQPLVVSESDDSVDCDAVGTEASTSSAVAPKPRIRHRATTSNVAVSAHRTLSPLPTAANLFTPHRQFGRYNSSNRAATRLEAVQRLPSAIINKTCEVLLAPPSQLIALMLRVAARITAGEWRGFIFGTGDSGERIPVQWDYSDDDSNGWHVDDGSPLPGPDSASASESRDSSRTRQDARLAESKQDERNVDGQHAEGSHGWEVD